MTSLLLAKIVLAPAFVALVSLAMRLWGGIVAGMMSGFPLITAPVGFFMAIEQGPRFAQPSAVSIQFALMGVTSYAIVYGLLAGRCRWPISQGAAVLAYFTVSFFAVRLPPWSSLAVVLSLTLVAVGLALLPAAARPLVRPPLPWWDVWLRVAVTLVIVLAVTAAADRLGPQLSAVFASYPAISSVLTPFSHARAGADAARDVVRGIILSHISFALLFAIVAATLPTMGTVVSYAAAAVAAIVASFVVMWGDQRLFRRQPASAKGQS